LMVVVCLVARLFARYFPREGRLSAFLQMRGAGTEI
jgi:hypothetical protein